MKLSAFKPLSLFLVMTTVFMACSTAKDSKPAGDGVSSAQEAVAVVNPAELEGLSKAYFASGCFWCVEAVFESVNGVKEVISGYAGGTTVNPTYEQVGSGRTGHAESVEVYYDPKVVSYETLLVVFFGSQDPTTLNRQGPDVGTAYRSVLFYQGETEKNLAEAYIKKLDASGQFKAKIVTEVVPFKAFYPAEDYHQNYEKLHADNPYVRNVSIPRLRKFQEKYPELLKAGAH